jgi:hypothetical protein
MFLSRTSSALASVVLVVGLSLSEPSHATAEQLNDKVIRVYEDNHIGWDIGRLAITVPEAPMEDLVVEFKALRRERLTSLSVHTSRWTLDLSGAVKELYHPYPSRITVVVREWNLKHTLLFLDLPFEMQNNDGEHAECVSLQLEVLNGKLIDKTTHVTATERCMY